MGQRPTEIGGAESSQGPDRRITYGTDYAGLPAGSGAPRGGEDNPDAIRAGIEQTRAELSETIDAIQEKINPDVLKEQAKDALRDATVGRATETVENAVASAEEAAYAASDAVMEVSESLMDTIRGNPIPSLLAGLGLSWLYMNRTPGRRTGRYYGRGEYRGDPNIYYRARQGGGRQDEFGYTGEPLGQQESGEGLGDMAGRAQERAGELVGDAREVAQQAGSTVSDLIRENPIPSALVGLGLGWLAMNSGSTRRGRQYDADYPYYYGRRHGSTTLERPAGLGEKAASAVGGVVNEAQSTLGQVADQAQSTVGQVADQAQSTASQVAGQAQAAAGQVQETVSDLAHRTRYQAERVEDKVQRLLHENPLAVGAAVVAAGALLGAALPSTERERELLGETRDNLLEQARGKAEEVAEKVQRVTESAGDEIQRKAREEGLTNQ